MSFDEADFLAERAKVTEVLRSLVDSPSDLDSTLQVILEGAVSLCHTDKGFVFLNDDGVFRHVVDVWGHSGGARIQPCQPDSPW